VAGVGALHDRNGAALEPLELVGIADAVESDPQVGDDGKEGDGAEDQPRRSVEATPLRARSSTRRRHLERESLDRASRGGHRLALQSRKR
jgi:hypothetical protein